jgi:flavin-dependent dehydrogenase
MVAGVEIAILGGGPAGAAAALTLLRYTARRVVLVEKTDYSQVRVGETVPPSIQPLLTHLGLPELLRAAVHLPAYGTSAAWGSDTLLSRSFLLTGRGDGYHLDRSRFDRSLTDAVAARGGLLLRETQVTTCEREGDWRVRLRSKSGAESELRARFVIDASGQNSILARTTGARLQLYDQLVGIVGFFRLGGQTERTHHAVVESCPDGWWYSALLPGAQMVGTFMTDPETLRQAGLLRPDPWLARLEATKQTRAHLAGAHLRPSLHVRPAHSHLLVPSSGEGWIAAGDAAAAFDPLASMGIGYAITSGIHAARAANDWLNGDGRLLAHHRVQTVRDYQQYLALRHQFYQLEQRWPAEPFWARRHVAPAAAAEHGS